MRHHLTVQLFPLLLLAALPLRAAYVPGELLYRNTFTQQELPLKNTPKGIVRERGCAPGKLDAIRFSSKTYQDLLLKIPLDPRKIKGPIRFEAWTKSSTETNPGKAYWGTKLQLVVKAKGKYTYPETPRNESGSWKKVYKDLVIGPDTEELTLRFGLEQCKGSYSVADFRIYRLDFVADSEISIDRTSHWKAADALPKGSGARTKYRGFMSGNDLSEQAIATLKQWNANLLRFQMLPGKRDVSTEAKYLAWIDDEIRELDRILPLLGPDFKVIIDLHRGPGSRINNVGGNLIGKDWNQPLLLKTWNKLARHYRGNPQIYGYDILNEPAPESRVENPADHPWPAIAQETVDSIRKIDPDTPIIIAWHGMPPFLLKGRNLIYSPHFYTPLAYTHQGILNQFKVHYPGIAGNTYYDRKRLKLSLAEIIRFSQKHHLKILIGEFSVINDAPGAEQWIRDAISLFEEYGWDWCYHAFREWPPWSIEHANRYQPSADNPRKQVLLKALSRNAAPGKK